MNSKKLKNIQTVKTGSLHGCLLPNLIWKTKASHNNFMHG